MRQVVEVTAYWGGELFSIDYVSPRERLEVPEGLEVRTRLVEAAPRTPRSPMDVPWAACATIAACAHAIAFATFSWSAPVHGEMRQTTGEDVELARKYVASAEARGESPIDAPPGEPGVVSETRDPFHPSTTTGGAVSLEEARSFGMIGLLQGHAGDGADDAWTIAGDGRGSAMWDDASGGGLALTGVGEGGGGTGQGVDLKGGIGATCDDACIASRLGHGVAYLGATRTSSFHCTLRYIEPTVTGRLPAESIRRVVHENLGRFRACYERGLARDPKLAGRVSTKFVIARDGSVATVADAGSELADAEVVSCIERAYSSLEFPESPSGVVSVVYPLELSPLHE